MVWEVIGRVDLGGRLLDAPVIVPAGLAGRADVAAADRRTYRRRPRRAVAEVGQRLAEAGADRAEMTNLAARHIHALRARLANAAAIVTANRAYGLVPR